MVTPFAVLSPVSDETLEGDMLRAHLHGAGVALVPATTITAISAGSVIGHDRHGEPWSADCDGIVPGHPAGCHEDALYRELAAGPAALARRPGQIRGLYRIGDAVAPRMISEAIFDGHRLAREIDTADPAQPAPYLREPVDLGEPQTGHTGPPVNPAAR